MLVVEDDPELRLLLARGLREEGFVVVAAANAAAAMDHDHVEVDLAVIDVGLPDADGRDLCQALRARGFEAPVLFLTARDAVTDRVSGFTAGGDDYVTKPFAFVELVVRLRALHRRSSSNGPPEPADPGSLRLDPAAHAATGPGGSVQLTPTEFRLLAALAGRAASVVRRRELVGAAWPDGAVVHDNTLDQYVVRLRRKLREIAPDAGIVTVRGVGYRLG
ncbi:MAG TPA: response regulator transcription factor [Solirubrobacteraceae bacterium]